MWIMLPATTLLESYGFFNMFSALMFLAILVVICILFSSCFSLTTTKLLSRLVTGSYYAYRQA
jgi:hypothetical protein